MSLAAVIVAFPLYLLVSRVVLREAAADPDKLESGIRKWLTYMALVIAASVFMGDLITALAYLLRGELTSRFLAKSLVVLVLSSGVFWYYFGGLRKTETAAGRFSRDRWMAVASTVVVTTMIVLGFMQLGAPSAQRKLVADSQRVQRLYMLSNAIRNYWMAHPSQLPTSLSEIPGSYLDPITNQTFEYIPTQGSQCQLCAVFASRNPREEDNQPPGGEPNAWTHPAGRHCFLLDATALPQQPSYNFYPSSTAIPFGTRLRSSPDSNLVCLPLGCELLAFSFTTLDARRGYGAFQDSAVLPLHGMLLREFTSMCWRGSLDAGWNA